MKSKKITYVLFGFYLLFVAWIILLKGSFSLSYLKCPRTINLIPFGASAVANGHIDLDEIVGNILIFFPFGIFMGVLGKEKHFLQKLLPIFLASLIFETIQFLLAIGAADITDLITNTSGGLAGLSIFFLLEKIFKQHTSLIVNVLALVFGLIFLLLIAVLYMANGF